MMTLGTLGVVAFEFRRHPRAQLRRGPLVVGLVFAGPPDLLVARLVAVTITHLVYRRQPLYKVAYNLALAGLETSDRNRGVLPRYWVRAFAGVSDRLVAALGATLAANTASHVGVIAAISVTTGRRSRPACNSWERRPWWCRSPTPH